VTVLELFNYVNAKVKHWARHNRNAVQTPVLLGNQGLAEGMELARSAGATPPPPLLTVAIPKELREAWKKCQNLSEGVPSPAVHTPHLWRAYLDTLLRCEQLVRANDPANAKSLFGRLSTLETKITEAQKKPLHGALGSLALPVALGWTESRRESEKRTEELEDLWKADAVEIRDKLGLKLKAEKNSWGQELLRVRWHDALLRKVSQSPERDLTKAREVLRPTAEFGALRPTESHFLALLARDVAPARRGDALLGDALKLCRQ